MQIVKIPKSPKPRPTINQTSDARQHCILQGRPNHPAQVFFNLPGRLCIDHVQETKEQAKIRYGQAVCYFTSNSLPSKTIGCNCETHLLLPWSVKGNARVSSALSQTNSAHHSKDGK
jgi:hypothetical protein